MNKKAYIKPTTEVIEIALVEMIASSFSNPEAASEDDVVGARGRRGVWGDLWADEE